MALLVRLHIQVAEMQVARLCRDLVEPNENLLTEYLHDVCRDERRAKPLDAPLAIEPSDPLKALPHRIDTQLHKSVEIVFTRL